ncbi:MAG: CotH kinase family protein [Rhodothermales bacterium]|nr:CotH kinase family protein [Rhodothermales bacterium]MBO6779969.1 CotH kinase family protein [Rhodothermales bacterium]
MRSCKGAGTTVVLFLVGVLPIFWVPGAGAQVFDDSVLPRVDITVDPGNLALMFRRGNEESDTEHLATFRWTSPNLTAEVDSVGFRLRGNTSRYAQKKSFKVSFNTFRRGGKWEGLEKLNLNGEHNDPSIMRSKLSWDLFADVGVPASRANHVELYINGAYYGLYMNVEHVDEQFLQRYFGGDGGNLYKSLWPADLIVRGSDGSAYRPAAGAERRPYDLTQGQSDEEGYEDIARFISVLNTTSDSAFRSAISELFDVPGFLKALAVTAITGSWDTYWYLKNNFYLYNSPETGRWHYIPFDMDNSFGIWWGGIQSGIDWSTRDLYEWGHPSEPRPLTERILGVPEFRELYTYYLRELLSDHFLPSALEADIDRLKTMTEAAAAVDSFRTRDYGWNVQAYQNSFTQALGAHVTAGLKPYISTRYSTAFGQLDSGTFAPFILDVRIEPSDPRPSDPLRVSVQVESDTEPQVTLSWWPDQPERNQQAMRLDGGRWVADIPPLGATGTVDLQISASAGGLTRESDLFRIGVTANRPALYINELMANNETTLADDAGEFDDWLELFNGSDVPLHLNGLTISDDPAVPDRWALPDIFVPENGYLVLWMDGQPEQGELHAPFRLDADGESVALYDAAGDVIDQVSFGALEADQAWGRTEDAGLVFSVLAAPSPGAPNAVVDSAEDGPVPLDVAVYPNPFSERLHVSGSFEVFDVLGRRVFRGETAWDSGGAAPGVYFVVVGTEVRPVVKVR